MLCYCADCQAFARFLGRDGDILDARGGSDVIQVLPKDITFTAGAPALACIRLTAKGLLRWYAACCNTPIGNTLASPSISFIGLLHSCVGGPGDALEASFGPVRAWVNTDGASGVPKPQAAGMARTVFWFLATAVRARLNGSYRLSPFFDAGTGAPVVVPRVLSAAEYAAARPTGC